MGDSANLPFWRWDRKSLERAMGQRRATDRDAASVHSSGQTPERRKRRRAVISAPVRVRSAEAANVIEEISTTLDVSRTGFLFASARADFSPGMTVAVTFPYSKSPVAAQAERPGRVVRVREEAAGCFAVAVAFEPSGLSVDASVAAGLERAFNLASSSDIPAAAPKAAKKEKEAERPLVIVVDSDPGVRDLLRTFLTEQGYEVMALHSARQAHALLDQMLPALVIAEIEGHDLPGYDLCARIKSTERLRDVPVVLTTQSAYPSDYSNAHSLGAVVCIAKPFRMERIQHVVRLLAPTDAARR
ncbi:MAG TPA: response regulator [Candidatus Dormibacteraeota bacterium]|nr:response regulator [Candidatus Dormibacteraeota bacterium]